MADTDMYDYSLKPLALKQKLLQLRQIEKQKLKEKKLKETHLKEEHPQFIIIKDQRTNPIFMPVFIDWVMQKLHLFRNHRAKEHAPKASPRVNAPTKVLVNPNVITPALTPFNNRPTPQQKVKLDKEIANQKAQQQKTYTNNPEISKQLQFKKDLGKIKLIEPLLKPITPKPALNFQPLKPSARYQGPRPSVRHSSYSQDQGDRMMHVSRMERSP